ncbi:monovalent cation/H+ antiporter subunit D [Thioalkalicoccus limnaeus]|uniref:Monovalent cation/H+ antiporter subunit D n=1 Tax=Thioalkalicoccus limnaeus TaxID=120681 RepID=A0ABV4BIV0_9GAMM
MNHWIILPLLLPLITGALLLVSARGPLRFQRALSLLGTGALLLVAVYLFALANDDAIGVYLVSDWPGPFGIVMVLDRLSALLLLLTAVLALGALLYAFQGTDRQGPVFHALFQFQLLGINGAFLTGDLFNLFVFFEILLIASYGLLLHGGGKLKTRAGLHYVVLNLTGSSLFLIAIGILYGVTGTLNMADLGRVAATLSPEDVPLAAAGAMLLLVVFALKAAILPLHFWLPHAYGETTAPVAALFAIMTKVGVYAIIRMFTLFSHDGGPLTGLVEPWLLAAALLTLAAGTFGAMASLDLRRKIAYLVMVSIGTLLLAVSLGTQAGLTGSFFYLVHSTLVTGAFFLIADLIAKGRQQGAMITEGVRPAGSAPLGVLYLLAAIAAVGLPPLSGLVGKVLILMAAQQTPWLGLIWTALLVSGLLILVSLARAGSYLFWRGPVSTSDHAPSWPLLTPAILLLSTSPLLVLFGGPMTEFAAATAAQMLDTSAYIEAVLGQTPISPRIPLEAP